MGYGVAVMFMEAFGMTIDTVLMCFITDADCGAMDIDKGVQGTPVDCTLQDIRDAVESPDSAGLITFYVAGQDSVCHHKFDLELDKPEGCCKAADNTVDFHFILLFFLIAASQYHDQFNFLN